MNHTVKITSVFSLLLASGMIFNAHRLSGQQPSAPPDSRPARPGSAPGLKVTDLGHSSRTYRVKMDKGDEIMSGLMEFAEKNHIKNAHFSGFGTITKGVFRWSDPIHKSPKTNEVNDEAEIVSFVGTIESDANGKPNVHGHMAVGLSDGSIRGGHLVEAYVNALFEVFVVEEEAADASASR